MTSRPNINPPHHKNRPARLVDVARVSGVSRWVAGHVLNGGRGNSRVSPDTAERIRQVAEQLGYQPNHAAGILSGKKSKTFGLLVASAGDPLRSFLVQYLDEEASRLGCRTLICNTVGNPEVGKNRFDDLIDDLSRRQVDGVFCAVHHWFSGDRQRLLRIHPNTIFYEDQEISAGRYVEVDRAEAVRLAVAHLAQRGRHRIALAVMSRSRPTHRARIEGYFEELARQGLPADESLVFDGQPFGLVFAHCNEDSYRWSFPVEVIDAAIDRLVRDRGADAIVAHDDFWAAMLIKQMQRRGIRVPGDVAVVGYLNHYLADWTSPALTTIDLQHGEAAKAMIRLLQQGREDEPRPAEKQVIRIRPKLIVREST